ncbi:NmrA family protein [Klebsiella pneumoniae]|uniref:NmrA family protein n=1 Tax=Klebsiella pneumoniae TaxID=573 RepID=A0A2X1QN67_KLEPN|nr:NmrA family protein [Klebsiella pneumoniae]
MNNAQTVLVFGATGQQGGSVARALLHRGWRVRALVRDPFSAGAAALAARGAELVVGTFEDRAAMRSADGRGRRRLQRPAQFRREGR